MTILASTNRPTSQSLLWSRWGVRGLALSYVLLMLVIPLIVIAQDGLRGGVEGMWRAISQPVASSALGLTLWTGAVMALINGVMGLLPAHVLVRSTSPGKALLTAIIPLPLAIPTLVTGVMLVVL